MAAKLNSEKEDQSNSPWVGFIKFLFLVFFAVMVFMLMQSMVHHSFFSGGQQSQHVSSSAP